MNLRLSATIVSTAVVISCAGQRAPLATPITFGISAADIPCAYHTSLVFSDAKLNEVFGRFDDSERAVVFKILDQRTLGRYLLHIRPRNLDDEVAPPGQWAYLDRLVVTAKDRFTPEQAKRITAFSERENGEVDVQDIVPGRSMVVRLRESLLEDLGAEDLMTKIDGMIEEIAVVLTPGGGGAALSEGFRVEPDAVVGAAVDPSDFNPINDNQWPYRTDELNFVTAWDDVRESNLRVAVLDTGVDLMEQDITPNVLKDSAASKVSYTASVQDDHGHGTQMASIIGAVGNNGQGIPGVVWRVGLIPIKVLDSQGCGAASSVGQGVLHALDKGARVLNLSFATRNREFLTPLMHAIKETEGKALVVAAAGNWRGSNDSDAPAFPASIPFDNVVSVTGSLPNGDLISDFRVGCRSVDLAAPGAGVKTLGLAGEKLGGGTSVATAFVSGTAILASTLPDGGGIDGLRRRLLGSVSSQESHRGQTCTGGELDPVSVLRSQLETLTVPLRCQRDVVDPGCPQPEWWDELFP